jgi:broad specificity phosphatase PhoE
MGYAALPDPGVAADLAPAASAPVSSGACTRRQRQRCAGCFSLVGRMMRQAEPARRASPLSTIWLARHSEVHNPQRIYYGRLPRMRLSAEGRRQAEALAEFFASRPLAAVYSSPLLRARAVARAVQARHPTIPLRVARDLHEVRTRWQGSSHATLDRIGWEIYAEPTGPDDETMAAILQRMKRWLGRVAASHPGGEVLGVTHGDPLLVLLAGLRGLPLTGVDTLRQAAGLGAYAPVATVARIALDAAGAAREIAVLVPPYEQAVLLEPPAVARGE